MDIRKFSIGVFVLSLMALPVGAQEENAEAREASEYSEIEEIVVTATKRSTPLLVTPLAVSAFTQEALDREGIKNAVDLSGKVPNLQVGFSPSDSGIAISVRGISSNNFTEIGDPSVALHVNGVYSPRPQGGLALMHDVEGVTVARGPQGVLFGRNSTSGTVNIIPAKPEFDELSGFVEIESGSWYRKSIRGHGNLPLGANHAVRVAFSYETADSWYNQSQDFRDLELDTNGDGVISNTPRVFTPVANPAYDAGYAATINVPDTDGYDSNKDTVLPDASKTNPYLIDYSSTPIGGTRYYATTDPQYVADITKDGIPNVDQRYNRKLEPHDYYGATNRMAARVSYRFEPVEDFQLQVFYELFKDKSPGQLSLKDCEKAEGTFFACEHGQWDVAVNIPGNLDMTIQTLSSLIEWRVLPSVIMENRLAYAVQRRSQHYDGTTAYPDPDHPAYGLGADQANYWTEFRSWDIISPEDKKTLEDIGFGGYVLPFIDDLQLRTRWSKYESTVWELQFKSDSDSPLQWIAGLFMLEEKNAIHFDVDIPFCCAGTVRGLAQSFIQPDRRVESNALFASFDYDVPQLDGLNVNLGLRYTEDTKSDNGGKAHVTAGYWSNPGQWNDPGTPDLYHESWGLIGVPRASAAAAWADLGKDANGAIIPLSVTYNYLGNPEYAPNRFFQSNYIDATDGTNSPTFADRVSGDDNTYEAEWDKFTYKAGFDYDISNSAFVYGYIATGFKAGGFGDQVDLCGGHCDSPVNTAFDYDPEENLTFEIGYKQSTRLFGGPLNIIITAFASDYTNLQQTTWAEVTPAGTIFANARRVVPDENDPTTFTIEDVEVPNSVGTLVTTNIAEATINGLEIEFDWRPYRNGRLFGWISYLDATIGNLPSVDSWFCAERALLGLTPCPPENPNVVAGDPPAPQRTTNFKGNRLPWSPEFSLAINFEHNWWVADGVRVSPYVSVNWHSEIFFQNNNFDEGAFHSGQKETMTADVAIRFIDENKALAVEVFVRNLTDELKRSWIDGGPGFTRASFYPPRHWGIKLNKRF